MNNCDLHVLAPEVWPENFKKDCLSSITGAYVNVFIEPAIKGNTAQARFNAIAKGSAKYVTFCDYDDMVNAKAINDCVIHLEKNPELVGVYTDYLLRDEVTKRQHLIRKSEWSLDAQKHKLETIHQLVVMRRDAVEKAIKEYPAGYPIHCEALLYALLSKQGKWEHLPIVGYIWRHHSKNTHTNDLSQQSGITVSKYIETLLA